MFRKAHRALGKLVYSYTREPISTRQKPQANMELRATHFVRQVLGLHYYE